MYINTYLFDFCELCISSVLNNIIFQKLTPALTSMIASIDLIIISWTSTLVCFKIFLVIDLFKLSQTSLNFFILDKGVNSFYFSFI